VTTSFIDSTSKVLETTFVRDEKLVEMIDLTKFAAVETVSYNKWCKEGANIIFQLGIIHRRIKMFRLSIMYAVISFLNIHLLLFLS